MHTAIIRGEAEQNICIDHATCMLFENYGRNPADLQPESCAELERIAQLWDQRTTANLGVEKDSGFYATLYVPKEGNDCPPTLALRGTVFHDARGIAIALRVKAWPAFAPSRSEEFAFGFAPGYEAPGVPTTELSWTDRVVWIDRLRSQGNWLELFAHQSLPTTVRRRISIVPPAIARAIPQDYRDIVLETTLELWLSKDQGDWSANVLQGVGERVTQYDDDLMPAVDDAMAIAADYGNRLRIVGHSLGGGLAGAAALYAKALEPEARIWAVGYDSSGVHKKTAGRLGSSLDNAFDAGVTTRAVEDEILTSMEKRSDFVPIASSVLRFTGATMPPPIGTYVERKGISPGSIGNTEFAPKWSRMPNLLPIEDQDLIGGSKPLATFSNLAGIFAASRDLEDVLRRLNDEISSRMEERHARRAAAEAGEEREEALRETEERLRQEVLARQRAVREAEAERREQESEDAARAAEAEAETNEPTGVGGFLYNIFDEPRDGLRGMRNTARDVGDEVGDLGRAAGETVVDTGRHLHDEGGDLIDGTLDLAGDAVDFAYRHSVEYLNEFVSYGRSLARESASFARLFGAIVAYHSDELAAFTFVFGPRR